MIAGSGLFTSFSAEGTGGGGSNRGGNNKGGGREPVRRQCPLEKPCEPGTDEKGNKAPLLTADDRCLLSRDGGVALCAGLQDAPATE